MSVWVNKYLDIPYVNQGFSRAGVHCYGLVWLVYSQELGIVLDKYLPITAADIRAAAKTIRREASIGPWTRVDNTLAQDFDFVLIAAYDEEKNKISRIEGHIGLAVGNRRVLHIEETSRTSSCPKRDHPTIRERILATYRHEAMLNAYA